MKTKAFLLLSLLSAAAVSARAETETVDGVTWTYRVENGCALLGGGTESTPAVPTSTSGALAVPSSLGGFPVRSIPDYAFQRCSYLTDVTIPRGVTNIAYHAFYGCLRLVSVSIPDGVSAIGGNAFFGCAFQTIELPGSLRTIDYMAFYACKNLEEITVPGGVGWVGTQVFCKCPVLRHVVLEPGVKVIGKNAFEDCPNLDSVSLPQSLEWIRENAFLNCTALESLTVPDRVDTVYTNAFSGCTNLVALSLPGRFKGKTDSWELPETCEITFRKRLTRVESNETTIDLRPDPRKVEPGASERLAFSAKWADPSQTAASVEIALDGAHYLTLPGGEGTFGWTPDRGGLFTFTHTAVDASGNPFGDAYQAQFLVDNYSFGEGDIDASGWSGVYDGQSHSISVTSTVDGATVKYATAKAGPYSSEKPSRKNVGSQTVWYVVEAPFYLPVTNSAAISISKRPLTVTAAAKTKVYGAADPVLTYTSSGLVSGESLTGALVRDAGENVGTYAIRQGTLAATSNYTLSFTGADFTITKGTIPGTDKIKWNVSGDGTRFVYDGAAHSVFLTDLPSGVTATYSGNVATNAGNYTATAHLVYDTANYETIADPAPLAWGIDKRPLTVTAEAKSKVYGATDPALTYNSSGLVSGESLTGALVRDSGENVGTYAIQQGTLAATSNYTLSFTGANFTITKGTIPGTDQIQWNVAADAATFLYDGAEHGVALTGLPAGVTATYAGNVATNAGSYTATAHLVYDTANYETVADPAPLAWSISKRPITLMAASKEKPYDGWPLEVKPEDITVAGSGYAPGECFAYGDYASITDVGEIPATFSYADSDTALVANYDVTVQGGQTLKITVGGDQISVTADSGVWAYDGETHRKASWTFVNGDKLLDGHVFDIAISTNSAVTTPAEGIVSNAFDHVKIVEESSGRDMTRNYNLFVYEGTLQVTNAVVPGGAIAGAGGVSKVYDGLPASPDVSATLLKPATVRYRVGDGAWTAEAPSWTHAGTYTAEFEVSAQFYDPATGTVQVAISPRPVTLASPTKSKPYDGTVLTFASDEISVGGDGIVAGESFAYSDFASITDAGRTDAAFVWAAGAGTLAADYDVTVEKGTLTVTRNAEEISVTAKSATWVYDGGTHALHEWTAENLGALVAGDALDVAFDPASMIAEPGETTNRIVSVKVMRGETDVTANYTVTWWPGTLKVTKAAIGPKMEGISTSATAVYDGSGHAATVAAPALLTAPVAVRYAATADGPWGAAPVAFTNAGAWTAFFRVEAPHYEPYVGTSTMTITPREVSLVSAGATKVYDGTPLRKDEVSVKEGSLSFAPGEGFTATCSGAITDVGGVENVFEYSLKANTKADNYTIRKEYGWLRVTPATLDIDDIGARASWRGPYDGEWHGINVVAPVPRAVVTYALESGNEEAYGSTNPTWKNVSSNTVFFKILAPNYEPGYGSATVVITKRTLTIKADPKSKIFGAADPVLTYAVSNLVSEDVVSGKPVRDTGEAVGTYAIRQGNLSAGGNYVISFTGATFEITPGGIVVDASAGALGYSGEYDGAEHGAALRVKNPATGATVKWAETSAGPWLDASPTFVDAGTNTVWWRVSAPNFETVSGTAPVIIAPRPISKASVGNLTNEWYTGYPVEPVPSVTDTVPITTNDWTVAWEDNVEVGTARAVVTGRRNYTGSVVREFQIVLKPIIVIVIDLSNVEVGQGKWGTASLTTNGIPVNVAAGSRVELELPQGTPVALSFTPNAGFKIGSVIVDRRTWTTQSEWAFEAKADRAFQASYIPDPRTTVHWKLAAATGHYHAQLAFPVYPGYTEALANFKFHFADRVQNGKTYAQLWDYTVPTTAGRHVAAEETLDGKKYRFVPLDASKMAGLAAGKRVVYGVTDATLATTTDAVPQAQRLIGLYILKRISPVSGQETDAGVENFVGAFSWETNGKTYYQPVGEGYPTGVIAERILDAEDLDAAEALGFDPAFLAVAEPACRFTEFSFDPFRGVGGGFEIYAATPDGIEAVSSGTTANAVFHLWGTERLGGAWRELKRATFPEKNGGTVQFAESVDSLGAFRFFRVTIDVKPTHE